MDQVERSAPSVEEAVEAALVELGASEQEVRVEILQEPRSGFLGVGSQQATVRVQLTHDRETRNDEGVEGQAEQAAEFLEELLSRMAIAADVDIERRQETTYVEVAGKAPDDEDVGLLIGRHGVTLEALQELARLVVVKRTGQRCQVVVDIEGYKQRQRARLEARAREVAARVARTGREEELEPMNAYERKVIHSVASGVMGVRSWSRGEEPERRVVLARGGASPTP